MGRQKQARTIAVGTEGHRVEPGGELINSLRGYDDHIRGRLACVVDHGKECEDQSANSEEMQKRLPKEPL